MIMEIILWTARGPVSVQVTGSRELDQAVSAGTSPETFARDALKLIKLQSSAG
jgi:hypothetical protein